MYINKRWKLKNKIEQTKSCSMSRKTLFLLAATIVVLYFSVILFILKPLHGSRSPYSMYHLGNHYGINLFWCRELRFRSPPLASPVALVSYPGSGNTWLRYLLQQSTGILTGSIYMDYGLRMNGFPAENVSDGSVLLVKTHDVPHNIKFSSAVLLVRNPRDAILAEFNRLHRGHIGSVSKAAFRTARGEQRPDWAKYVANKVPMWEDMHRRWLQDFSGPVHVVIYETLVNNTRTALSDILRFLNQTVSEEDMDCAIRNKEGIYRRRKKLKDFDPYTIDMYRSLNYAKDRVNKYIEEYERRVNRTTF